MTDDEADLQIRQIMFDVMCVLYKHGITNIHIGGFMRLLGVDPDRAAEHDDELIVLDDKFAKYVQEITDLRSSGQTIH